MNIQLELPVHQSLSDMAEAELAEADQVHEAAEGEDGIQYRVEEHFMSLTHDHYSYHPEGVFPVKDTDTSSNPWPGPLPSLPVRWSSAGWRGGWWIRRQSPPQWKRCWPPALTYPGPSQQAGSVLQPCPHPSSLHTRLRDRLWLFTLALVVFTSANHIVN